MMSAFSDAGIRYLKSQRIGRLATVGSNPAASRSFAWFSLQPRRAHHRGFGGHSGFAKRKKYRDFFENLRVAFVVDDVPSVNPLDRARDRDRQPAQVLGNGGTESGPGFDSHVFRIRASRLSVAESTRGISISRAPRLSRDSFRSRDNRRAVPIYEMMKSLRIATTSLGCSSGA